MAPPIVWWMYSISYGSFRSFVLSQDSCNEAWDTFCNVCYAWNLSNRIWTHQEELLRFHSIFFLAKGEIILQMKWNGESLCLVCQRLLYQKSGRCCRVFLKDRMRKADQGVLSSDVRLTWITDPTSHLSGILHIFICVQKLIRICNASKYFGNSSNETVSTDIGIIVRSKRKCSRIGNSFVFHCTPLTRAFTKSLQRVKEFEPHVGYPSSVSSFLNGVLVIGSPGSSLPIGSGG